jgi:hypothetical protein
MSNIEPADTAPADKNIVGTYAIKVKSSLGAVAMRCGCGECFGGPRNELATRKGVRTEVFE